MLQAEIKQARLSGKKQCRGGGAASADDVAAIRKPVPQHDQQDTEIIEKLLITGPTKETIPRIQICAKTKLNKRLFVCTLRPSTYSHHA